MRKILKAVLVGVAAVAAVLAVPVWHYFPGYNFRTVAAGSFYGARQMPGDALGRYIDRYHVKTVLNCRGENKGTPWYEAEVAACRRANVAHEDFSWSRNSLPSPESLARYVEVIEHGTKPFLAHCEGGTHRTGVAAAVYLLLQGSSVQEARQQFGPGFRGAPIGDLLALYERSGSTSFKDWVARDYAAAYGAWKANRAGQGASQ